MSSQVSPLQVDQLNWSVICLAIPGYTSSELQKKSWARREGTSARDHTRQSCRTSGECRCVFVLSIHFVGAGYACKRHTSYSLSRPFIVLQYKMIGTLNEYLHYSSSRFVLWVVLVIHSPFSLYSKFPDIPGPQGSQLRLTSEYHSVFQALSRRTVQHRRLGVYTRAMETSTNLPLDTNQGVNPIS